MTAGTRARTLKSFVGAALCLALGPAGLAPSGRAGAQTTGRPGPQTIGRAGAQTSIRAGAQTSIRAGAQTSIRAGAQTSSRAGAQTSSPTATVAVLVARNRQAAIDEAQRLLGLAKLPPGALRAKTVPEALAGGPVLGTPGASSLVVQTQYWRAPLSFDQVQTWLEAHPPQGLKSDGSSNGGGPSPADTTIGFGYVAPSTAQLQSPELEIGAASAGPSRSAIRVDAVVVWTDPRPWPDNAEGRRTHVNVAEGCPASVAGIVGVTNPGPALTTRLLPAGEPTGALVCRYNGSDGPSGALPASEVQKLAHQAWLSATGAALFAQVVSAAPISRTVVPGGTALAGGTGLTGGTAFEHAGACPMDDGAAALLAFSYPGRPDVDLWAQLSGCSIVANGYILGAGAGVAARVKLYG